MAKANSLSDQIAQELSAATTAASMSSSGTTRHIKIEESDLPSLIPDASLIRVKPCKFGGLKMGDLICIRTGSTFAVRRFVKTKMMGPKTLLLTVREGFAKKEALPTGCLLGKIEAVNSGESSYDPLQTTGLWQRFWGMLTEYGTHKPFGLIPV